MIVPVASSKRKGKAKGGAVTGLACHLHLSPLHLHQRPGDRQAKTSATNLLRGGVACPVEASEEPGLHVSWLTLSLVLLFGYAALCV